MYSLFLFSTAAFLFFTFKVGCIFSFKIHFKRFQFVVISPQIVLFQIHNWYSEFRTPYGAILAGSRTNTTVKTSQKMGTRSGNVTNTPKEDTETVEPDSQPEHRRKEGCLPRMRIEWGNRVRRGRNDAIRPPQRKVEHLRSPTESGYSVRNRQGFP